MQHHYVRTPCSYGRAPEFGNCRVATPRAGYLNLALLLAPLSEEEQVGRLQEESEKTKRFLCVNCALSWMMHLPSFNT